MPRTIFTASEAFSPEAMSILDSTTEVAKRIWSSKNSPKFLLYSFAFVASTTVTAPSNLTSRFSETVFTADKISESLPTPEGSIKIRSGWYCSITSFKELSKSPTKEQQIQPWFISRISIPAFFKKPLSTPISPNSFSIRTTFSPFKASESNFCINVVFPAPKKPEIISIFVIKSSFGMNTFFYRYKRYFTIISDLVNISAV